MYGWVRSSRLGQNRVKRQSREAKGTEGKELGCLNRVLINATKGKGREGVDRKGREGKGRTR